jgi:hypothetical protein
VWNYVDRFLLTMGDNRVFGDIILYFVWAHVRLLHANSAFSTCHHPTSYYKDRSPHYQSDEAQFNTSQYQKKKKPMPSNGTYVFVKGFISGIEINPNTSQAVVVHVSINFLGKSTLPPSPNQQGGSLQFDFSSPAQSSTTGPSDTAAVVVLPKPGEATRHNHV